MKLTVHTPPEVPLEAEILSPTSLAGLSEAEVSALIVHHGNRKEALGEFFSVSGKMNGRLELEGDLSFVKLIGQGMADGEMFIEGNVSGHLGCGMSGGRIVLNGDAQDWVGEDMTGGSIMINGNAGHTVGSGVRGAEQGMLGGEIFVRGNCKNEAGGAMRRGLVAIGGNSGDFTGLNMLAGTVIVLGEMGIRTGSNMKRGSVISMNPARMIPSFSHSCTYQPIFLRFYLNYLRDVGFEIDDAWLNGSYQRWCGDAISLNKGEVLLYQS
jgi:formylmethanofuran dehydrogenase subunit C